MAKFAGMARSYRTGTPAGFHGARKTHFGAFLSES
jgi:hypothetical protein